MEYSTSNIKIWSRLGSCGAFGMAALEFESINPKIIVLTSDLTYYSGLERYKQSYGNKLFNVGIAEQNMIGVAAGLADEGFIPFATTYATFASMRCADQVRVNMGYMKKGIKLIGLTSGLSVGILGATHICIEDIAVMRSIPNIRIISPADCTETVKSILAVSQDDEPTYIRLTGTQNNPIVYEKDFDFIIGKAIKLKEGKDISIIATGSMVYFAMKASEILKVEGIMATVIDMHTIKPIDTDAIMKECKKRLIVTIEEHSIYGGLGGAVAEVLAGMKSKPPQLILGINDDYGHAANYEFLLNENELTPTHIVNKILNKLGEDNNE